MCVSEIVVLPYDNLERITDPKNDPEWLDCSNLEVVMESDYDVFLNGTIKVLKDIKHVPVKLYAEKYDRGQWHVALYNKKLRNFCTKFHSSLELWYYYTKNFPRCPLKAGVRTIKLEEKN